MNRALIFVALSLAFISAFGQDVEVKSFTGNAGSGNPAVWKNSADEAISSAKSFACQFARSKARQAGFVQETGSASFNIPSPKYDERYGHKILNGTASCTIDFARLVEPDEQGTSEIEDEDERFRRSVEQELLKALLPNFPSGRSVAIRTALQQALRTRIGRRLLGLLRSISPTQRQRAAYRAVDKLERTLRGITEPKLKDIEGMFDTMANELAGKEISNYERPSSQNDDIWNSIGITEKDGKSSSDEQQLIARLWADSEKTKINAEYFYEKWGGSAEIYPANVTDEYLREREQLEKQKLQKSPQINKPPAAKPQATKPKMRTFKMRFQNETQLVTNEIPDTLFGEYLLNGVSRDQRYVLEKNGRFKIYNARSGGWSSQYKWGASVKNGKVKWRTGCGATETKRSKVSVTVFFEGTKDNFVGCLHRDYKPLNSFSCGHLMTTSKIRKSFIKKC